MKRDTIIKAAQIAVDPERPITATTAELAGMLGLSKWTIRRYAQANKIIPGRVTKTLWLYDVGQVVNSIMETNPLRIQ
jgi:predicted transcriptional regulator